MHEFLTALVETQELIGEDHGVMFQLSLPEDDQLWVQGIEGRLGQVLRNMWEAIPIEWTGHDTDFKNKATNFCVCSLLNFESL